MKNLIRKVLKEENDFEWAGGLSHEEAEAKIMASFKRIDRNYYSVDSVDLANQLLEFGITNPGDLEYVGDTLENMFDRVFEEGRERGYESCDCDGCCDEMVYYEDADRQADEARERGYESGYDDAKDEYESQIEDLNEKISDLESELEELKSQLNENLNNKNKRLK